METIHSVRQLGMCVMLGLDSLMVQQEESAVEMDQLCLDNL